MHMGFWFGSSVQPFLLNGFDITSSTGLVFTCLALMSLGILFEGLKLKVQKLAVKQRSQLQLNLQGNMCPNECDPLLKVKEATLKIRPGQLAPQVLWYVVQTMMSYILMLAVMTFNGYLALSVVAGAGLGYLVFGPAFMDFELDSANQKRDCPACRAKLENMQHSEETSSLVTELAEGLINSVREERLGRQRDEARRVVQVHHSDI